MDIRARAALVAAPDELWPYSDVTGHVRERGRTPAPRPRGTSLLRAAAWRVA